MEEQEECESEKVRSERYGIEGRSCRDLQLIKRTLNFILKSMIRNDKYDRKPLRGVK